MAYPKNLQPINVTEKYNMIQGPALAGGGNPYLKSKLMAGIIGQDIASRREKAYEMEKFGKELDYRKRALAQNAQQFQSELGLRREGLRAETDYRNKLYDMKRDELKSAQIAGAFAGAGEMFGALKNMNWGKITSSKGWNKMMTAMDFFGDDDANLFTGGFTGRETFANPTDSSLRLSNRPRTMGRYDFELLG